MSQPAYEFDQGESSTTEGVKEKAQGVAEQVKEKAGDVKDRAGGRITQLVDRKSTESGQQVVQTAQALRRAGEGLREQGQDAQAKLAEQAAERTEMLGAYLCNSDGDRILRDVEDFARRQPVIVAAGAFVLGLAGARFLKASSSRRQDEHGTATAAQAPAPASEEPAVQLPTAPPTTDPEAPAIPVQQNPYPSSGGTSPGQF
jgi:hypothetical protein